MAKREKRDRKDRKGKRKKRVEARRKAIAIAMDVYESGDDAESLTEKVVFELQPSENTSSSFWIEILKYVIPLVLKLLTGI